MDKTPTLHGDGIQLLPLRREHVSSLNGTHDASTWQWMSESGATPALMAAFVDRALAQVEAGTAQAWATCVLDAHGTAEIVGCTRLADWNRQHRTGEIGWTWVAPEYRGTGLNARVKLLQLRHCFGTLGLRRVALKTHHANLRSQRAMQRIGAQFEGVFRNHMLMPDGTSRDTHWYSIVEQEWPAVEALLLQRTGAGQRDALPLGALHPIN